LNWDQNIRLPSYQSRLLLLNLPTHVNRRTMLGTIFMQNLIRGDVDSVELLSCITFNVTSPLAFCVKIITAFII